MHPSGPFFCDNPVVRTSAPRGPIYGVPRPGRDLPDSTGSSAVWSVDSLLRILVEPLGYFRERRDDCAFSAVASFCMVHAVVATVVGYVAGMMGSVAAGQGPATQAEIVRTLGLMGMYASVAALASLIVTVAAAALIHPVVLLVRGRGGYQATYAAVVYSMAPVSVCFVLALYIVELMPGSANAQATARWLNVLGPLWSLLLFWVAAAYLHSLGPIAGVFVGTLPLATATACAALVYTQPDAVASRLPTAVMDRTLEPFGTSLTDLLPTMPKLPWPSPTAGPTHKPHRSDRNHGAEGLPHIARRT